MELFSPKIKKCIIFSKKSFSYILGNRTLQEMELSSSKIKKFLISPEMKISSFIFFLYFGRELSEPAKLKKNHSEKISYISGNGIL